MRDRRCTCTLQAMAPGILFGLNPLQVPRVSA